ncbi:MAG: hypothetical protein ACE5KA_06450 [Nitrososphaerales archaeon]
MPDVWSERLGRRNYEIIAWEFTQPEFAPRMEDYEIDHMARIVGMHTGRIDWHAEALLEQKMEYVCLASHNEISFDFDVSRKRSPFGIFDPSKQEVRIHIAAISNHRKHVKRKLHGISEQHVIATLACKYLYTDTHETLHAILWKFGMEEYTDEPMNEAMTDRLVTAVTDCGFDCNWIAQMLFPEEASS